MRLRRLPAALAALFIAPAMAQDIPPPPDPAAVEAFVDGVVESFRRENGIAGVSVAVVSRDGVLLEKGYGIESLEPRRPVDAARTQFRIASISKTFVYVMAMQLAAEGRLDLTAPADTYLPDALKFEGDGFPVPRVIDLMQHTAGFEDSALGHLFSRKAGTGLEDYLVRHRPKRVRPPGAAAIYSNYSVNLLGLIIARLDGRSFEDSAEARLFGPLGMDGVTFREPPNQGEAAPSQGFKRSAGWFAPQPAFYVAQAGPSAGAHATAHGMVPWMRMLLNGGALDGTVLLAPDVFAEMVSDSFRDSPVSGALAHGFLSRRYGALGGFGHDGAGLYFYSGMVVWPEAGLALFVTTNTDTGYDLTAALPTLFIEHFVPAARPDAATPFDPGPEARAALAGPYLVERRNQSSFEGFLQRVVDTTAIRVRDDGTVVIASGGGASRYVFESADVLRSLETGARIQIIRNADGSVYGYTSPSGVNRGVRLAPWDTPAIFTWTLGGLLAASLFALFAIGTRLRYGAGGRQGGGERLAGVMLGFTALAWIGAAVTLGLAAQPMFDVDFAVLDYPGPLMPEAQTALHVAAGLSLLLVPLLWPAWTGRNWRLRRVTFTLYVVLAVAATILLARWGALLTPLGIGV